ncbi:MAG: aldo/keto reductase [Chloroflexi bacterium]|nr:MAG: aldo/keto reductase [Chloroflexota bacterium]
MQACPRMEYKPLGRTGLKVSAVGLGCGNFGGIGSLPALFGQGESEREAHAIMDAADEMGINFFDTANAYGGGRSEAYIGSWLRARGPLVRHRILLSSKVFNPVGPGVNDAGLSRLHIMQQIESSLKRLGTDYADMYLLHEPEWSTPLEETLRAFDDLIKQGFMAKAMWLSDAHGWVRLDWVQNAFSLFNRRDERELLPLCAEHGLGYTPFSPLAGGWLTGKYRAGEPFPAGSRMTLRPEPYAAWTTDGTFTMLGRFGLYAQERGTEMATLALAWLLGHPQVTAPIVGPRKPTHLDPARQAVDLKLSQTERDEIAAIFGERR